MPQDQQVDTITLAQQARGTAKPVDPEMLDTLFIGLLRSVTLFDDARRFMSSNQFRPGEEAHYACLWGVLCDLREEFDQFSSQMLYDYLHREFRHNPTMLHPNMQARLLHQGPGGLLFEAFTAEVSHIDTSYCRALMRNFLLERTVLSPLRQMMTPIDQGLYADGLPDFLQAVQRQQEQIMAIESLPTEDPVPTAGETIQQAIPKYGTGLKFIDDPLGGVSPGAVYGLLAVTGGGKTTLGFHLATSIAQNAYAYAVSHGFRPGLVAYFTYEESAVRLRPRLWSAAAQIPRDRLAAMTQLDTQLRTEVDPTSYEKYLAQEGEPKSELERWNMAKPWLSECVRIFDMSGSEQHPNAGTGMIDEIAAALEGWQIRTGQHIIMPIIDYAGLCCKRFMMANNQDDSKLRGHLSGFGHQCLHKIASRFHCPVWVFHQIAPAEAMKKNPATLLNHTQAAESRAFAENMVACGCVGIPDPENGVRRLNWSKVRDTRAEGQPPYLLQVSENYAHMIDVTDRFTVHQNRFITGDDASRLADVANPQGAAALQGRRPGREIAPEIDG